MKVLAIAIAMLAVLVGCAASAPVNLNMTLPTMNAVPGTCSEAVGDTLKDLSQLYVYAQKSGASDSTLVLTLNVAGLMGQPISVTVDRPEAVWNFWATLADATGNRSCRSNVVTKSVVLAPAPATLR